jgi:hypothetical protein
MSVEETDRSRLMFDIIERLNATVNLHGPAAAKSNRTVSPS